MREARQDMSAKSRGISREKGGYQYFRSKQVRTSFLFSQIAFNVPAGEKVLKFRMFLKIICNEWTHWDDSEVLQSGKFQGSAHSGCCRHPGAQWPQGTSVCTRKSLWPFRAIVKNGLMPFHFRFKSVRTFIVFHLRR